MYNFRGSEHCILKYHLHNFLCIFKLKWIPKPINLYLQWICTNSGEKEKMLSQLCFSSKITIAIFYVAMDWFLVSFSIWCLFTEVCKIAQSPPQHSVKPVSLATVMHLLYQSRWCGIDWLSVLCPIHLIQVLCGLGKMFREPFIKHSVNGKQYYYSRFS